MGQLDKRLLGVVLALTLMGCEGAEVNMGSSQLVIETSDATHLDGYIAVETGRLAIHSTIEHKPSFVTQDETGAPVDNAAYDERVTTVADEAGILLAQWSTRLDNQYLSGSYGGQTFGDVRNPDADNNPTLWAPILASAVGRALAVVSSAAASLAAAEGNSVPVGLGDLAKMSQELMALSSVDPTVSDPYATAGCEMSNAPIAIEHFRNRWGGLQSTMDIERPMASQQKCGRNYYGFLYNGTGDLLGSCATSTDRSRVGCGVSRSDTAAYVCRRAVFFDSYHPAIKVHLGERCGYPNWCVGAQGGCSIFPIPQ